MKNSALIEGIDFSANKTVNDLIADPANWPVVLYPGPDAIDITAEGRAALEAYVPPEKQLVIFVIDGSWFCARKMIRVSDNLRKLPQIKFNPPRRSQYRIRRQPKAICFASIEAVHYMIDRLGGVARWRGEPGHDNLLEIFDYLVEQQLAFSSKPLLKS